MGAKQRAAPIGREFSDDRMLSFSQWCQLNNISEATGRRILGGGNGPNVVELSPRRIGITVGDNRAWRAANTRAAGGRS